MWAGSGTHSNQGTAHSICQDARLTSLATRQPRPHAGPTWRHERTQHISRGAHSRPTSPPGWKECITICVGRCEGAGQWAVGQWDVNRQ